MKYFGKIKNAFKMNKNKRIALLIVTLVATILSIILGSVFYVGKNANKSIEYGGGHEWVLKVDSYGSQSDAEIATDVAQNIYGRIDPLGVEGAEVNAETNGDDGFVRVTYPVTEPDDIKEMEDVISRKPVLTLTDYYGNPLFNSRGGFNSNLKGDPGGFVMGGDPSDYDYENNSHVPLKEGGASAQLNQQGGHDVNLELDSLQAGNEWADATDYVSKLPDGKNVIVTWLDISRFIDGVESFYTQMVPSWDSVWSTAQHNPMLLAHVDGDIKKPLITATDADPNQFLLSSATVKSRMQTTRVVISGNFSADEAQKLSDRINYGVSNYGLSIVTGAYGTGEGIIGADYGSNSFKFAVIAGLVVFLVIAFVLIFNYGLLGALSTVSIALFLFMTLLFFTVMHGQYSPVSIAALIIGIGMSVDANIITFERLKSEVYAGASVKKAFETAQKKSFTTIFDANLTTLIIAFVLFYFGTREIIGLSVTLMLSIVFTLIVMLLYTRLTATLLVRSGVFADKRWLIGTKVNYDTKLQSKIDKIDYIGSAKWFAIGSGVVILAGAIVFAIFAGMGGSAADGFHLSIEFAGGQRDGRFVPPFQAQKLVTDSMIAIAIAMGLIVLYTLVRFKWTYSIAAIVALLHDALIVIAVFTMFRVQISPIFITGLLTIIGYSINDTIVTFDRLREKMNAHVGALNETTIKKLANDAVRDTFKRSVYTSLTTIIAVVILMSFGNVTELEFNLAMLVGLISGTYSSIFIATYLWTKLELARQRGITRRVKNNFWKCQTVEEQTIQGINNFNI